MAFPSLKANALEFAKSADAIVSTWLAFDAVISILERHDIALSYFKDEYALNVYGYIMGVVDGSMQIGQCPVMIDFLAYLKDKNIASEELFIICTHLRRAMITQSYQITIHTETMFVEISYLFDQNFSGLLAAYSDTIYEKEQELAKSVTLLSEYRKIIDESALVSKTDVNGTITFVNENFSSLCGYSAFEMIGKSHNILRHETMQSSFFVDMWKVLRNGEIFKGVIKNRKKNGDYFYIDITIAPIFDTWGNISEYMSIGYDVTTLVDSQQEAVAANASKDAFLSNMSHEIRTPLNAIIGFISVMLDEPIPSMQRHYLEIMDASGKNLLSIINNILDFSKLRSGDFAIEMSAFNTQKTFVQIGELYLAQMWKKEIAYHLFIDPLMPTELISDADRITQICQNLLNNAVKFTPNGGTILFEVLYLNEQLHIRVEDSGAGIVPELQHALFQPFHQLQKSTQGTGLGLSIVKQLSEKLGGSVTLTSEEDLGARFDVKVPARVAKAYTAEPLWRDIASLSVASFNQNPNLQRYFSALSLRQSPPFDIVFVASQRDVKAAKEAYPQSNIIRLQDDDNKPLPESMPMLLQKIKQGLQLQDRHTKHEMTFMNASVLVVEDNEANQELMQTLLEKMGVTCTIAEDGKVGLQQIQDRAFDLIILDEQLPFMNGSELFAYAKKSETNCKTPLILLSADISTQSSGAVLTLGFDEIMSKPVEAQRLKAVIQTYVKQQRKEPELRRIDEDVEFTYIDISKLETVLELDRATITLLLEKYSTLMSQQIEALHEAMKKNECETIKKLAHAIKGASANFRFEVIVNAASGIESCDETLFHEAYTTIVEQLRRIRLDLKQTP